MAEPIASVECVDDSGPRILSHLTPLEGPIQHLDRPAFQTVETATVVIPSVGFGTSPKAPPSVLDLGEKAFEFVKTVTTSDPIVQRKFSDHKAPHQEESMNPMKYKRARIRRVSILSSDGSMRLDFLTAPKGNTQELKQELQQAAPNLKIVIKDQPVVTANQALSMKPEPPEAQTFNDADLMVPAPMPDVVVPSEDDEDLSPVIIPPSKTGGDNPKSLSEKILNHWFFRNPDATIPEEDEDQDSKVRKKSGTEKNGMEGVGDGQLTKKVISALGLKPDPKESRKMNMWMPQSM